MFRGLSAYARVVVYGIRIRLGHMADLYPSGHLPSREVTQEIWCKADAVCFDVDSTLVTIEGLDSLAEYCGVGEEVKQWTKRAMGGSVTFQDSLQARLNIVQATEKQCAEIGLSEPPEDSLDMTKAGIIYKDACLLNDFAQLHSPQDILSPSVEKLVRLLQKKNTHIYLVSGGFRKIIEPVMDYLNIPKENLFANRMIFDSKGCYSHFDDQEPTSRSGGKPKVIEMIKKEKGYKNVVMIGDGATDLEACPPADAFIGYGGNVVRQKVKENATWFVTDFQELINVLVTD